MLAQLAARLQGRQPAEAGGGQGEDEESMNVWVENNCSVFS